MCNVILIKNYIELTTKLLNHDKHVENKTNESLKHFLYGQKCFVYIFNSNLSVI